MTTKELISATATKTGFTQKDVKEVIDTMVAVTTEALVGGEEVKVSGIGSFKVVPTAARTARNPQTGATIEVEASKKVKVSITKSLKDAVKNA